MRTYAYLTLDVFTAAPLTGNQLAVLLDARGLSDAEMLAITREFNYSESTFVLPAESPDTTARVRIFTPGGEVPFAGHPTLGTAIAIARTRGLEHGHLVLGETVGPVPVDVHGVTTHGGSGRFSVAQLPEERDAPGVAEMAEVLSLDSADLLDGDYAPRSVSCGLPWLLVPLVSVDAVSRVRIDHAAWRRHCAGRWASEPFVFAMTAPGSTTDVQARAFCPGLSVPEDPATGSANAALAGFLAARTPRTDGTLTWTVAQGVEMQRPSRLVIEADKRNDVIVAARVGGDAVVVAEGTLRVP
ncbi:MAG: PhzF family phenazine biosynthesis protein [Gemmatimonadaceae bacterium]|jgi:trans-2,3-dihydro-3-hydroxyanthranilate isomerase|nr:PhzF family phenazine biosynthesis protein [Gemmatimonadaceae bacterium]